MSISRASGAGAGAAVTERLSPESVRVHWRLSDGRERARFADDVLSPSAPPFDGSGASAMEPALLWHNDGAVLSLHEPAGPWRLGVGMEETRGGGIRLDFRTGPDEGFFGFGEWFNAFRRTSGRVDFFARESPAFTQKRQTYSAFPCFLSDAAYLVLVLNAHPGSATIHPSPGRLVLEFEGGEADLIVVRGPSLKRILREYTRLTGRPPLLPRWAFGLWNTAYPVEDARATRERVLRHRKTGVPLDCVILDYHWENAFHDFRWRSRHFPEPDRFLAQLRDLGVRTGLIYTPFLNRPALPLFKLAARLYAGNAPRGTPLFAVEAVPELYEEARSRGYFAAEDVVWWLGRGGMLDMTNPEAVEWWFALQRPLLDQGVSFFKNDDGEYLPLENRSHLKLEAREHHNLYGFYYGRAVYEKTQAHRPGERALVFSRMFWAGSQRFPAVFLGDQRPRYDDLRRVLRAGLNLSLQGFAYWAADVLGLYRTPGRDLHQRYAQATLLGPIARYFSSPNDPRRDPWGSGQDCLESFRTHALLRMQLLPYLCSLGHEAFVSGLPIVRPLLLEFEEEREAWAIDDQFLIGDRLLVAPVLSRGDSRLVYFPGGPWYEWWTGAAFRGPQQTRVSAPQGRLPVFVRGGHPLLLGPTLESIPDAHAFTSLSLHLFRPYAGQARIYEDDGRTLDYQDGGFAEQLIDVTEDPDSTGTSAAEAISIRFAAAAGPFAVPPRRDWRILVHGCHRPKQIEASGTHTGLHWSWDPPSRKLEVTCSLPTDSEHRLMIAFPSS